MNKIVKRKIADLIPYANNAKEHTPKQIENLKKSLTEFGWVCPCVIKNNVLIVGHGRIQAAKELGWEYAECIERNDLTDEQADAYRLLDNLLSEGGYDGDKIKTELQKVDISGYDFSEINTEIQGVNVPPGDWFENRERWDNSREEGNEEYNEFLEKIETAKTTDDCYTPDNIYEAVCEWVEEEYGVNRKNFVRPFYPNGDYQKEKYKAKDIVVDNPPFSILAEIVEWYCEHNIKFFIFAPTLSIMGAVANRPCCALCTNAQVTYENGAKVPTSFITNLDEVYRFMSTPSLYKKLKEVNTINERALTKELPKYSYPVELATGAGIAYLSVHDTEFKVRRDESYLVRVLDSQKEQGEGKAIYGSGYLISEKAAAEKAAAEKAAAEKAAAEKAAAMVWKLSDRERAIIKSLGAKDE